MPTSSARPDHLARFADDLTRRTAPVSDLADRAAASMSSFLASSPDATPLARPDIGARLALIQVRSLAMAVDQVGAAFARADRQGGPTLATASDVAIADAILLTAPGLAAGDLLAPRRARQELASRTGRQLVVFAERRQWAEAQELLRLLPEEATADPRFGAELFEPLSPQEVMALTAGLFAYAQGQGTEIGVGIRRFSRLHNAATRAWADQVRTAGRPAVPLHRSLAGSAAGRIALRRLACTSHLTPSAVVLTDLIGPLFEFDGMADRSVQDDVTRVVDVALHGPELSRTEQDGRRHVFMNRLVAEAAARPSDVREPLATLLAESVFDDQNFWAVRSERGIPTDRAQITSTFEAIARHDRSFLTLTAGLELRQRQFMARAVTTDPTASIGELDGLDHLSARLAEGAGRADRPGDPWGWAFTAADAGLDVAQTAIPAGGRAARIVLRPVVDAGMVWWHENSRPDPGTRQDQVERQRARRRANAWAAVAAEPVLADRLVVQVADGDPMSAAALRALGTDPDDITGLGVWEAGQPDDLVALVDRLSGDP